MSALRIPSESGGPRPSAASENAGHANSGRQQAMNRQSRAPRSPPTAFGMAAHEMERGTRPTRRRQLRPPARACSLGVRSLACCDCESITAPTPLVVGTKASNTNPRAPDPRGGRGESGAVGWPCRVLRRILCGSFRALRLSSLDSRSSVPCPLVDGALLRRRQRTSGGAMRLYLGSAVLASASPSLPSL